MANLLPVHSKSLAEICSCKSDDESHRDSPPASIRGDLGVESARMVLKHSNSRLVGDFYGQTLAERGGVGVEPATWFAL